ncbi:MAG: non-canonical purine NTP pyrophosphatase [Candidatus Margulisiibacteriota bacterium]|nr:MAG: non-canonical purine NTP pyrophosphatase, RdgB/HAM1 family [Candidatus Margulisbacteria bacterium GWD2_39_127]OGI02946.1 MAG: non-canonical purine NTP pyrophosphatase, RdgB/HAM1 family [Candidatus Margulisbacteria bacterium GWF2_38_17]OGI09461.1 MAG: non-canonical purine NTP pyrophosphatase, RdgB/HAM1 family [Candidatus Margulisbacteria bacterium GWE2_39_32]PZM78739.1 MAG: non-canonical purine NTP pyrophosphatase [Candidatus Margulisiibacteriota bacterium]HAR63359.1 non-canonical purine
MKLLIATKNNHKSMEIRAFFEGSGLELESLLDYPEIPETIEDGNTFEENAIKKARECMQQTGILTLADDSGLEVDILGGKPGVLSARFAGPGASGEEMCKKIIDLMSGVPWEKRTARFRCVIAIVCGDKLDLAQGTVEGYILNELNGEGGFGYDPIFYYPPLDKTLAQIDLSEKNKISHRGQALTKAKMLLEKYKTIS